MKTYGQLGHVLEAENKRLYGTNQALTSLMGVKHRVYEELRL
jgi:hypothetical protein